MSAVLRQRWLYSGPPGHITPPQTTTPVSMQLDTSVPMQSAKNNYFTASGCAAIIVGIFIIIAVFGSGLMTTSPYNYDLLSGDYSSSSDPGSDALELLSGWSISDGCITGQVRNNTSITYGYVQIEFNLYDSAVLSGCSLATLLRPCYSGLYSALLRVRYLPGGIHFAG